MGHIMSRTADTDRCENISSRGSQSLSEPI